ncbi:disulfide bond formation protein DsbA [Thalassotalea litorea]|uniref:Disulfide bond formation protein DsbA n=1 Tax=Thalassotalea litorea TaxID=2020715 RepID=A0A5R9IQC7_9GAMM|nr:DsbA family protein [Thalassotalea litorea]TLU66247.1 disulfide bond formation protein DsbA [Thalassotalea litorea]
MKIKIDYFTDVLCVWAYINERRIAELNQDYLKQINLSHHYVEIFASVADKMASQWQAKGGYGGFREHVVQAAEQFQLSVHSSIWQTCKPTSSAPAHLYGKAFQIVFDDNAELKWLSAVRQAFFIDGRDISQVAVLDEMVNEQGVESGQIKVAIDSGAAIAALMLDRKTCESWKIKGSPSLVMNQGRQILFGNVGYGIIRANIEELRQNNSSKASWC